MSARQRPRPAPIALSEAPSNVVVLRPGFSLPTAVETKPGKRPRRTGREVTTTPDFLNEVTKKTRKKGNATKDLLSGPGLTQVSAQGALSPLGENPPSAADPTFQRQVAKLPAMKLREVYHLEATAHRNMMGRSKGGRYRVAAEFHDFRRFLAHVGPCPAEGWTLDRRDPRNTDYGPGLVRWADKRMQANNRTVTVFLTLDGITRPLAEWARLKGVDRRTLAKRIERGWSHEEAIRGRRLEDEAPGDVEPTPEGGPACPEVDGWPAECDAAMWETAFRGFLEQFGGQSVRGITRGVFLAWLVQNQLGALHRSLRKKYPAAYDPEAHPDDPEPEGMAADPDTLNLLRREPLLRTAMYMIGEDRDAHEALRNLRARWPNLIDPRIVPRVARYEVDDD